MDKIVNKIAAIVALSCLIVICFKCLASEAICPDSYKRIGKGELIKLDREVGQFFKESYEYLETQNVTYEEQLFKSIRASRHTTVINYHDFKYSDVQTMRQSEGARVNDTLCLEHLGVLINIARANELDRPSLPLSAIDFLESSGRSEAGALNGNSYWKGSEASCIRAKLLPRVSKRYLLNQAAPNSTSTHFNSDEDGLILGRYSIVHLRAKSWPKWDKFFEDRISIKMGLCIPDTCHSRIYLENAEVKSSIDFLARHNLMQPFNGDRYEISYLYCFPDDDSQFRQYDLPTKLFIAFAVFWTLLTVYANYKYQQRAHLVRKLREAVDIRMIISQKRDSDVQRGQTESDEEYEDQKRVAAAAAAAVTAANSSNTSGEPPKSTSGDHHLMPSNAMKSPQTLGLPVSNAGSNCSSLNPSPMPSEVEDNDGDFGAIRPLVVNRSHIKKRSTPKIKSDDSTGGPDFIKAFSIGSNLDYLFRRRKDESDARASSQGAAAGEEESSFDRATTKQQRQPSAGQVKTQSQQFSSAINRCTSSSNEALIKDLQQQQGGEQGSERKTFKVAIVSSHSTGSQDDQSSPQEASKTAGKDKRKQRRVNMDILDGIKVIATGWIVYGHTMMLFFGLVNDLRFADERMFDFTIITLLNTLQVVSMFYIITGALVTYLAFSRERREEITRPAFWILAVLARYFRLMPAYLLVFWFARNVATHTGNGASWSDYRTDDQHVRQFCTKEPWSVLLTMSAADIKIPFDCVPQAWYLSNDFRTLLILPIYVVILAKNRVAGYVAILATFVYSSIKLTLILRTADIDYEVLLHWTPQVYSILADRLHDVYTDLSVRLSTYLLGVVVGHLLYLYNTRQIKKWPAWFTAIGLKLALMCATIFFLGAWVISNPTINQFLPTADQVDSDMAVILIPVFKTAMEMCMSVGILLLVTGSGYNWINELLSSNVIKVLSNVSYGVFLIHVELMYKVPLFEIESNYWLLFIYTTFYIAISNIIAFLIYLLYEMPIHNIQRYAFQRAYKTFVVKRS